MDRKLLLDALAKFTAGAVLLGALLFLPAGSFQYRNAWLFLGLLLIPMFIAGFVMMFKAPELLRKRLNAKEKQSEQKDVIRLSGLMFIAGFLLAGFGYRFAWPMLPAWAVAAGCIVFLLSYLVYAEVLRENVYLSRTIEVQENQKVIDTGLYGIVRHPMYSATVILFLSIPVILGSLPALAVFLLYPFLLVRRILNEEQVLREGLAGYPEYCEKVKYRLIPFIW